MWSRIISLAFAFIPMVACTGNKKENLPAATPVIALSAQLEKTGPFTYAFTVTHEGNLSGLKYKWNFGEGTTKDGSADETFTYADNSIFHVTVTVTNLNSRPATASVDLDTHIETVTADPTKKFQTIEGFGGFGAQDVYWGAGPFTSARFVNDLINDLGLTILRDNLPLDFEITNDNNDPFVTDLTKYHVDGQTPTYGQPLRTHIQYLKDMKAAGLSKLIMSVWSPMPWMKNNNSLTNGTNQNAAPPYNANPTSSSNQLRTDMYDEFAEMCVAYVKIIRQEVGIDLYALSVQNEPRFSQSYESCVYNGEALRDLIKVVGKRFHDEGLTTKLFMPEDVGYFDGINGLVQPVLGDDVARNYVDIIATHGYAFDGVTAASTDAQTWQAMYNWGKPYNKPLWMTETSGFSNDFKGAMDLSKAMYTALNYGNISAWLFWELSQSNIDEFALMSTSGTKSKRYYVSKNFYRYIRPGAVRFSVDVSADAKIYPLAFYNAASNSTSIVFINDNTTDKVVHIPVIALPTSYEMFVTSGMHDCDDMGAADISGNLILPANSVTTLVSK